MSIISKLYKSRKYDWKNHRYYHASPMVDLVQSIEHTLPEGYTLSRWETNSRFSALVKRITYAIHKGERAARSDLQPDVIVSTVLSNTEGTTPKCQAHQQVREMWQTFQKLEPYVLYGDLPSDTNPGNYGSVHFEDKEYFLDEQATLSNRVFTGWWGDAEEGDEYTSEWQAAATDAQGDSYLVVWQFDAVKGQEPEDDSNWPWFDENIVRVIPQ